MYRQSRNGLEVFLVHPGGPFFQRKDFGAWSIPKGEIEDSEAPLDTARREFREETGLAPPEGEPIDLGEVRQKGGKVVSAWALSGDCDPEAIDSQTFTIEWPPRSGRRQSFPEVDRAAFFSLTEARKRVNPAQVAFLDRLADAVGPPPRLAD